MKSILMIGQSNMAGRGFINEVPMICNERILMLRNAGWQMMAEPINYDRPNAGIGLAGSFAAMWCMEHVLVVVYANCDMYSPVYMGS